MVSFRLEEILNKTTDGKKVFGTSFAVKLNGEIWNGRSGNFAPNQSYFIASTTKLFTTAIIFRLIGDGKLNLNDTIDKYLDTSILTRLHVINGREYSNQLTIRNLLAHTSGLPDYFQNKGANGKSLEDELKSGNDQFWTFEQAIERTKEIKPRFAPDTQNKAWYSDSNFQLLGKIIENITAKSFTDICGDWIINPLGLLKTYIYHDITDKTPKSLYYNTAPLHIPKAMASFIPDGGIVSTSADMLTFIEAFFTGKLFPENYIKDMQVWNNIFYPLQSGIGIHRFKLPWLLNPAGTIPEFIGHSGLSGALAFYAPQNNLFIAGTVNQVANPGLSFRVMIKLTQQLLKKKH